MSSRAPDDLRRVAHVRALMLSSSAFPPAAHFWIDRAPRRARPVGAFAVPGWAWAGVVIRRWARNLAR